MATQSNILAWRIPWTQEPGVFSLIGQQELDMTERLSTHSSVNYINHVAHYTPVLTYNFL